MRCRRREATRARPPRGASHVHGVAGARPSKRCLRGGATKPCGGSLRIPSPAARRGSRTAAGGVDGLRVHLRVRCHRLGLRGVRCLPRLGPARIKHGMLHPCNATLHKPVGRECALTALGPVCKVGRCPGPAAAPTTTATSEPLSPPTSPALPGRAVQIRASTSRRVPAAHEAPFLGRSQREARTRASRRGLRTKPALRSASQVLAKEGSSRAPGLLRRRPLVVRCGQRQALLTGGLDLQRQLGPMLLSPSPAVTVGAAVAGRHRHRCRQQLSGPIRGSLSPAPPMITIGTSSNSRHTEKASMQHPGLLEALRAGGPRREQHRTSRTNGLYKSGATSM